MRYQYVNVLISIAYLRAGQFGFHSAKIFTFDSVNYLGYIGTLAVRIRNKEKALKISDQLKNIDKPYLFGIHTYWRANIAALLDDKESAMKLVREALGQGT